MSAASVIALIERDRPKDVESARFMLTIGSDQELELHEVSTRDIRAIYERRAKRPSPADGVVEFVDRLASYAAPTLLSTGAQLHGKVLYLFLSEDRQEVLGCIVASDHRKL